MRKNGFYSSLRLLTVGVLLGTAGAVGWIAIQPATAADTSASAPANRNRSGQTVINIQDFKFVPATITVTPGSHIVWINRDDDQHLIVSDNGAFPASGPLNRGDQYSVTLAVAGEFHYHCGFHAEMRGEIHVVGSGPGPASGR